MNRCIQHTLPLVLVVAMCAIVAACTTPEQLALQRQQQEQADMDTCASYGLRPGSEAFGNCRLQLDLAREQRYYYYDSYPRLHTGFSYHHWH